MPKIEVTNEERRALGRVLGLAGITKKDHKTIGALYIKITDAVVDLEETHPPSGTNRGKNMKPLTKRQRTRVRRVLNNFAGPLNHMSRDGIADLFEEEYLKMKRLRTQIRDKAKSMGYDPEEALTDVNKESYHR